MQVGSAALHGDTEQVINIHAGRAPATVPIITRTAPAHEMTEVIEPLGRGCRLFCRPKEAFGDRITTAL